MPSSGTCSRLVHVDSFLSPMRAAFSSPPLRHSPITSPSSEALLESFLLKGPRAGEGALTAGEKSVVQLIAEGKPHRIIAEALSISVKSVELRRASALKKINADSTAALIRYAIKNKLVEG